MARKMLAVLLVLTLISGCLLTAGAEAPKKKITVMLYMCGANLESDQGSATSAMSNILRSGYNADEVNVVAMLGGATRWWSGFDPKVLSLVEVSGRKPTVADTAASSSMGDPNTLFQFLWYAYENYPAENYALILWDHGGGPIWGVCEDYLYDHDGLFIPELTSALAASPFSREKLSWIAFDTCLMATVETASALAPYARYMIASEESTYGMSYDFMKTLHTADMLETGKTLADTTLEYNRSIGARQDTSLTMSLIDLEKIPTLEAEMNSFFSRRAATLDALSYPRAASARRDARSFGRMPDASSDFDLVDLGQLLDLYHDPEAAPVRAALDQAVMYHTGMEDDNYGLSVYHPFYNKAGSLNYVQFYSTALDFCSGYTSYIQNYSAIMNGLPLAYWNKLRTAGAGAQKDMRTLFNLQLTPDQVNLLSEVSMIVARLNEDETYSQIYATRNAALNDEGMVTAEFTGTALYVTDAEGQILAGPLPYSLSEKGLLIIPAKGSGHDEETGFDYAADLLIHCSYDPVSKAVTPAYVTARSGYDTAYTSRYGYTLDSFDTLTLSLDHVKPTFLNEDNLNAFSLWETVSSEQWQVPADSLNLLMINDTIDETTLYATFQVSDLQGNRYSSEPLVVKGTRSSGAVSVSYDDDLILVNAFSATADKTGLRLSCRVANRTETERVIRMENITVNGIATDISFDVFGNGENWGLLRDEEQLAFVTVSPEALSGLEKAENITFDLTLLNAADDSVAGAVPVSVSLSLPLNGIR